MNTSMRTWRAPARRLLPYETTATAALLAVTLAARAERPERQPEPVDDRDWDAVHDAALDSFPASDAPSWSPLRVGPPRG